METQRANLNPKSQRQDGGAQDGGRVGGCLWIHVTRLGMAPRRFLAEEKDNSTVKSQ